MSEDRNKWSPKDGDWVSGHVWEKNEKKLKFRKNLSFYAASALITILFIILIVVVFL